MTSILQLIIKFYWLIIPVEKRNECIFKESCSRYVFSTTNSYGILSGLRALRFRYKNCRSGFEIFNDPITNKIRMVLPDKTIVDKNQIAIRLVKKHSRLCNSKTN